MKDEWFAKPLTCHRCGHRCTHFGIVTVYDPVIVCGRCGAINRGRGATGGSAARALRFRQGFVQWLLDGSPRLRTEEM